VFLIILNILQTTSGDPVSHGSIIHTRDQLLALRTVTVLPTET